MFTVEKDWKHLSTQQMGRFAEYLVKMKLTFHRLDIYSPEIDDRGIDFVIRTQSGNFLEIQVKAVRSLTYLYIQKSKMEIRPARYVAVCDFTNPKPMFYLIPSNAWASPNKLFKDRNYEGKSSAPEWGLDLRENNMYLLEPYQFDDVVMKFPFCSEQPA
jgi:hypothetical protein